MQNKRASRGGSFVLLTSWLDMLMKCHIHLLPLWLLSDTRRR